MFVYKLEYEGLVLYVGKTKDMRNRYYKHCSRKNHSCGTRDIPLDMPWKMSVLEECEGVMGVSREQFYYDTLKPLYNKYRPGQTNAEWRRLHSEKVRETYRKYDAAHRQQRREYHHKYDAANREQRREARRKHQAANRETINAKKREKRRIARASSQGDAALITPMLTEAAS